MAGFNGWQSALLRSIGAPVTASNLKFLNAWQQAEGGSAAFNPLNTTQGAAGASAYNSNGGNPVKNYISAQQGLKATAQTLLNGHYGDIVNELRSGKVSPAQLATSVAQSPWGTGSGVLRVLGSGPVKSPNFGASPPQTNVGPETLGNASRGGPNLAALSMLQQSMATAQGEAPDPSSLLALVLARQQAGAAQQTYGAQPTKGALVPNAPTPTGGKVPFLGSLGNEDPRFLRSLQAAAAAVGGTKIRVTSGERSPEHNAAIGGASHSNHLPDSHGFGHAMDGEVFIPGKGWIPLGVALQGVAPKFGLRSGATFQWGGKPDVVHVDDGFNQR